MTTIIFISLIGTAAIGYMLYFFIALCKESRSGSCHLVYITRRVDNSSERPDLRVYLKNVEIRNTSASILSRRMSNRATPDMAIRHAK